jgi:thiol-disulfide isomerase/thioredoxin
MNIKQINYLLILLLATLSFSACNQQSNNFKVTGKIQDVSDGDIAMLYTIDGMTGKLFVQDTIRNGKFTLEGDADSLEMLRLLVKGNKFPTTTFAIWIAPGTKTYITGTGHYISTWDIKSNLKEQKEEELYRNAVKEWGAELDSLYLLYYENMYKEIEALKEDEKLQLRTERRLLRKKLDSLDFIQHQKIFKTMASQPITESWINRLADYAGYATGYASLTAYPKENALQLQALYNMLSDEQKQSRKGELIHRYIFPLEIIKPGNKMVSAELYDPEGKPHKLAEEYRDKHILLDFWGVGCKPCIEAFPEMKELHNEKKDQLTIISITTDTENIWKEGLENYQLPWVNLTDYLGIEGYPSFYGVRSIPFYVLISPDGIVQEVWSGYSKGLLREKLKDI